MTSRDLMPFGKYKGTPIGTVPKTYLTWLFNQEGAEDKFPVLFDWFCGGDNATATPKEVENNSLEESLLLSMPTPFKLWWLKAYGDRLRKCGPDFYIPYLRVAIEAWTAASRQLAVEQPRPEPPAVPSTLSQPLNDNRDETVNF